MNYTNGLTIFVPTMNRSAYIKRMLGYYSSVDYKGYICIGDSSDEEEASKNREIIASLEKRLNIIYVHCPMSEKGKVDLLGIPGEGVCIKIMMDRIPTKYAVVSGDDDFQVPNGAEECIKYLEENPDWLAAQGVRVSYQPSQNGPHGEIALTDYVDGPLIDSDSATERWISYMRNLYAPLYAVHRTETWRRIFRDFDQVPMRYLGSELFVSGVAVILGKIANLDCLSVVTQQQKDRILDRSGSSMYATIIHPNWKHSVQSYRRLIIESLSELDPANVSIAEQTVDRELWRVIYFEMKRQFERDYPEIIGSDTNKFREYAKRIPLLTTMYRRKKRRSIMMRQIHNYRKALTLKTLLKTSSPFHADFMPVYRAIVNLPAAN